MISIIIPTFNERENIEILTARVGETLASLDEDYEVIIVDDNSPDGTANEVSRLQQRCPWLKLLVRENERGLGKAVVAGWKMAKGNILGCMDGDLQHPPELLENLLKQMRQSNADVVIASRYTESGGVSEWKFHRRVVSWLATKLANFILPGTLNTVKDPMSGFFLIKRSISEGVNLDPVGYKILLEVLCQCRYSRVLEIPYVFEERVHGGSKIDSKQVILFLVHLFRTWYKMKGISRREKDNNFG
jgi:dolichol-phosphate mannosyltransferase